MQKEKRNFEMFDIKMKFLKESKKKDFFYSFLFKNMYLKAIFKSCFSIKTFKNYSQMAPTIFFPLIVNRYLQLPPFENVLVFYVFKTVISRMYIIDHGHLCCFCPQAFVKETANSCGISVF